MPTEIRVPTLGESVTEATIARWLKQPGEAVARDEPVVELETDKVTLEVPAPAAGVIGEIRAVEGSTVAVGAGLGTIADGAAAGAPAPQPSPPPAGGERVSEAEPRNDEGQQALERAGPAVRKLAAEREVDVSRVAPSGPGGRLTKADVLAAASRPEPPPLREM